MEEFKVDAKKLDSCAERMEDYGKQIQAMQGNISDIKNSMRHKLSAMEEIGDRLRKIGENLEKETAMMSGLGSALGLIAGNYRNSEKGIADFSAGAVSKGQINRWQQIGKEFEMNLEPVLPSGMPGGTSQSRNHGFMDTAMYFDVPVQLGQTNALGVNGDGMNYVWQLWDDIWTSIMNDTFDDLNLSQIPEKIKAAIASLLDPMGTAKAVDDIRQNGVNEDNLGDFIFSTIPSAF